MLGLSGALLLFSFSERKYTRAELGKLLFSEKLLSRDSSVSCASCHRPEFAFADSTAFSIGINGTPTLRNTPSVLNMSNRPYFFWDGRARTLEEQALMPVKHPGEMGLPIPEAVERLNRSPYYSRYFRRVFGKSPDSASLSEAFAAFEQTLETDDSRFDRWGEGKAELSASEERGRQLFVGSKAKCFDCHLFEDFTHDEFRNIGLFDGRSLNDSGRYLVSRDPADLGAFKTPGLRNVALTAPYMHNGLFATLEEVIEFYNDPRKKVPDAIGTDSLLRKPLGLTAQEQQDLVAFLKTLTDSRYLTR